MAKKTTVKADWLREMREKQYDAGQSGKQPNKAKKKRSPKEGNS